MITTSRFFWLGILLGFIGCLFYANFREPVILFDSIPLFHLFTLVEQPILLPDALSEWIPSFLHVIGMSFFTAGLLRASENSYWKIPVVWMVIDLIFEGLQYFQTTNVLTWGHFEWVDVLAIMASTIVSAYLLKKYQSPIALSKEQSTNSLSNKANAYSLKALKPVGSTIAFSVGAFMMLGSYINTCTFPDGSTYDYDNGYSRACLVDPIYISWEEITASGQLSSQEYGSEYQQPLKNVNKIYIYHDLLLINELMKGVHFYDNTDPANPVYLDFISLIGNQDMAIKDNYLYLDSFNDLLIYDLNNLETAPVRKGNVFTIEDARSLLPENISFRSYRDSNEGVVIGYENKNGKRFYFWPEYENLKD